jgi:hypothetical protein
LILRLPALLCALALTAAAPGEKAMHHATGTFEVKITPEAQGPAPEGGLPTARMGLAKTFSGGMTGTAVGTMLSAGMPKPGEVAVYVAVDQFRGTVDGKAGGFVLLHRGTMTKAGGGDLSVVIAPDSGTGALEGIEGTLSIEVTGGQHKYDLTYTLPAKS